MLSTVSTLKCFPNSQNRKSWLAQLARECFPCEIYSGQAWAGPGLGLGQKCQELQDQMTERQHEDLFLNETLVTERGEDCFMAAQSLYFQT